MKTNEEEKGEFVLVSEKFFNDFKETEFFSSIYLLLTFYREAWQRYILAAKENHEEEDGKSKKIT